MARGLACSMSPVCISISSLATKLTSSNNAEGAQKVIQWSDLRHERKGATTARVRWCARAHAHAHAHTHTHTHTHNTHNDNVIQCRGSVLGLQLSILVLK